MFADMSRRNVYLLKIGAKSFSDGSQDIFKDTESTCSLLCFFFRSRLQPSEVILSSKSRKESSEKMFPFKV